MFAKIIYVAAGLLALLSSATALPAQAASDFRFREYIPSDCNHADAPSLTFPYNNEDPFTGNLNTCYSTTVVTRRIEIDLFVEQNNLYGITYCDEECQGGNMTITSGHCFAAPPGCTIGAFQVRRRGD